MYRLRKRLDKNGFGVPEVLLVIAVIAAWVIIAGLIVYRSHNKPYIFNGPSMEPTIKNGERVTVKLGRYTHPKIGDIVLLILPNAASFGQPNGLHTMKRVVALPNDKVVIKNNKLVVYDSSHPNGFDPDDSYGLENQVTSGYLNLSVPSSDIFVLGDNRPVSLDSRVVGPVPISDILGQVTKY